MAGGRATRRQTWCWRGYWEFYISAGSRKRMGLWAYESHFHPNLHSIFTDLGSSLVGMWFYLCFHGCQLLPMIILGSGYRSGHQTFYFPWTYYLFVFIILETGPQSVAQAWSLLCSPEYPKTHYVLGGRTPRHAPPRHTPPSPDFSFIGTLNLRSVFPFLKYSH